MGRHSADRRDLAPREIARLAPASQSGETPAEARRRQRELRITPAGIARRRERRKRVVFGCLAVALVILLAGAVATYAYYRSVEAMMKRQADAKDPGVATHLDAPRPPGQPFYMLLIGEDTRPGEVRARSDTLIVAYVNPPARHVTLLSIPRDTRVDIPGHGTQKINAAMQIGGASLAVDTVKALTGIKVSHYMEVDFWGFEDVVNAMGGVWVDVPQRIYDMKAANHHAIGALVPKGFQKLDGRHALTFVRARHLAGDDWTRIKDQQIFLKALAKQMLTVENFVKLPRIVNAVFGRGAVTTDLTIPQLYSLIADFKGAGENGVTAATVPGTAKYVNGISYVIADDAGLRALVKRMEAGDTLEQTSTVSTTSTAAPKPANVTVAVRNGAGQTGLAAEVAAIVTKAGFRVKEVGNTARPVYAHTLIVFKTDDAKAKLVSDSLGLGTVVKSASLYTFTTDVLVVVGKDWRKQNTTTVTAGQ
jgi:polyisoprenyl-teichoic acid--peptidoglycan teichoic acid transferase